MLYSYFDILVLVLLLFLNTFFGIKKPISKITWKIYLPWFLFFFLLFPYISAELEASIFHAKYQGQAVDGFNTLYIWGRWPMYWIAGFLEVLFLKLLVKKKSGMTFKSSLLSLLRLQEKY